ncbi:MAG: hypothetical protein KGI03_03885 [Patescibacteria group bacterium]|nr:hypothetical protein [Patescibacteria group bacterium]
MTDPREGGFNYASGWGPARKPPIYLQAAKLARRLTQESALMSARAWALELALWRVRIATTGVEKARAVLELSDEMHKLGDAPE